MKLQQILKNKKGFTLMELIVVLVIMAILAAALLPSFLNFVTRARNESMYQQARLGLVAAQLLVTENGVSPPPQGNFAGVGVFETALVNVTNGSFILLVDEDVDNPGGFSNITISGLHVVGITYTSEGNTVRIGDPPPA